MSDIRTLIGKFEEQARCLETTPKIREELFQEVHCYTEKFLTNLKKAPTYWKGQENKEGFSDNPLSEEASSLKDILNFFQEQVIETGLNPPSPGYLAYIPGGGLYPSALGDYLAAVTNRYAGVFFASPGAVRMENMLLRWLAKEIGYPESSAGNLTSGGSIANLIGIVTGRETKKLRAKDFHKSVIYLGAHTHHSVTKSVRVAGMQDCLHHLIALDDKHRMIPELLEKAISQDKAKGLTPWLVVASAGTTDVGAVDPLDEIATISEKYQLWFHVDGAYGGLFALCPEGKEILQGIDKSDSLVIDPHKSLFLPFGSGAVLVREKKNLFNAHNYEANYMQDAIEVENELSPGELSPEFTKHFRGLRMWLPLKLFGVSVFRAALSEKLYLARYFYEKVQEIQGIEVGPFPQLSVVIFRYLPDCGDTNKFNQRLIQEIQEDGRIFLSSTLLEGKFTLRLAVLCFRTHLEHIDLTLDILREKIDYLLQK